MVGLPIAKVGRIIAPVLVLLVHLLAPLPVLASEPCNPPNLIPQPLCDMNDPVGSPPHQLPNGWTPFVLAGDVSYNVETTDSGAHSVFGPPSLRMHNSGGTFKAGIYTQVPVSPGAGYRASISWGAPNAPDTFGRQLGIDPTGGTDPNSPNIIWGPIHWGPGRMLNYPPPDVNIDVRARAVNSMITVFFLVDHPTSTGDNFIYIDALALYPDESAPPIELPPTETPLPPTPEPVVVAAAIPPTATPLPPTATATETPTATPTDTPTTTPMPTDTPSPTPTITPTWTPWPTASPPVGRSAANELQVAALGLARSSDERGLILLGTLGFSGVGLFGGSLLWLRRRR